MAIACTVSARRLRHAPPPGDLEPVDRLLTLMDERLSYMDDVARNKWNSGAAIEDLPREAKLLRTSGVQAAGYGLSADIAQDFLRAQIEASKIIQHTRFAQWKQANQPPFTNAPDLRNSIRPALDRLTPLMMRRSRRRCRHCGRWKGRNQCGVTP